jgi:hypothetical protein
VFIWYIFSSFGIRRQEKSGNPGRKLEIPTLQSMAAPKQGDQMSLEKNRSKRCPNPFLSKLIHNFSLGKSYAMIKTTDHGSHTLV